MTIPSLTAAPDLPDRTEQDQTTFDTRMAAYWAYLKNDFEPELNLITPAIDSASSIAAAAQINAINAEASASASANYKGLWAALTGSLSVPASVYHDNKNWQLLQNLSDVTSVEPGTNGSYWFDLSAKYLENATASEQTIFNAADTSYLAKARLSDTQTLYAYRDSDNYLKAIVATVSESGITFSNEFQVSQPNAATYAAATAISYNQVAITWYNTIDYDAYIRVLTYTSGTNTIAAACDAYAYHTQSSGATIYNACCAISSTKIAIFYNNHADSGKLYGQVLSWNGSILSVATAAYMLYSAGITLFQAELISGSDTAGKICITFFENPSSRMAVVNWTSASGFTKSNTNLGSSQAANAPIVVLNENTAIAFSRLYNSTYGYSYAELFLYYVGGSSPVLVRRHQLTKTCSVNAGIVLAANSATKIASGKVAIMLCTNVGTEHTLFVFSANAPTGDVNASTLELLTEQTFSRDSSSYFTLSKTTDNNLLYAYRDDDNSGYGTIEKIEVDL